MTQLRGTLTLRIEQFEDGKPMPERLMRFSAVQHIGPQMEESYNPEHALRINLVNVASKLAMQFNTEHGKILNDDYVIQPV